MRRAAEDSINETRRRSRLSRLGLHFLFVAAFAMLGGALRGLNLLLVLAGLMVGALLVQWRWSRRTAESMSLTRRLPSEAFAGQPFRVRFRLTNHARMLPAWMLRIDDHIRSVEGATRSVAATSVAKVAAGDTAAAAYDCVITRRGRYRFGPATVSTSFPFGLMTSRLVIASAPELDIFPRLLPLRRGWERTLLTRAEGAATCSRRTGPAEGDFFGLREWQTGDNPRWIHWRTTARLGELAVRQFEQERRFDVCLLLDGFGEPGGSDGDEAFETAVSLAASLLVRLVAAPANRVVLAIASERGDAVVGGGSPAGKRQMLSHLAGVGPAAEPRHVEAIGRVGSVAGRVRDMVVISPRGSAEAIAASPQLAHGLQPWGRIGTLKWLNVSDPSWLRSFVAAPSVTDAEREDSPDAR